MSLGGLALVEDAFASCCLRSASSGALCLVREAARLHEAALPLLAKSLKLHIGDTRSERSAA